MPQANVPSVLNLDVIQAIGAYFVSVKALMEADSTSISTEELTECGNKLGSLKAQVQAYADLSRKASLEVQNGADIDQANQHLGSFHAALTDTIEAAQKFVTNHQSSNKMMALQLKLCKLHPATVEGMAQRLEAQSQQHAGLVSVNKSMSSLAIEHSVVREALLSASSQYNAPNVFRAALQAAPANSFEAESVAIAAV